MIKGDLTNGEMALIGAMIKSALDDWYCKDLQIPKNTTSYRLQYKRAVAQCHKNNAKWFFEKSRLFKLTQLDLGYLRKEYKAQMKKGVKKNVSHKIKSSSNKYGKKKQKD